jgi:hypothetical protein
VTAIADAALPLLRADSPRMFALGDKAAAANLCRLYAIVPTEDSHQPNPLIRHGMQFVFQVYTRRVHITISIRDLNGLPEHIVIQSITEVLKSDRVAQYTKGV